MNARRTDFLSELVEDLLVSRDEQDIESSLAELLREGFSNTGCAAGHDYDRTVSGIK